LRKRRWLETGEDRWLDAALDAYSAGLTMEPDSYYCAINVASLRLGRGDTEGAMGAARQALALAEAKTGHWAVATVGESCTILGDLRRARRAYSEAARGTAPRDISAMRRQARRNLKALSLDPSDLDTKLAVGTVACIVSVGPEGFAEDEIDRRTAAAAQSHNVRDACVSAGDVAGHALARAVAGRWHQIYVVTEDNSPIPPAIVNLL
jgi:hypothetical protein